MLSTRWEYIVIPVIFYYLLLLVMSLRWRVALRHLSVEVPLKELFLLYLKHNCINQISPGSIVGDGYRVVHLNKKYDVPKTISLSTVIIERVVGLSTRVLLFFLFSLYLFTQIDFVSFDFSSLKKYIYLIPITGIIFLISLRFFKQKLFSLLSTVKSTLLNHNVLIPSIGFTLLAQVIQIVMAYGVALMVALPVSVFQIGFAFVLVELIMLIPVSVNGWGTRELVLIYTLGIFGVDPTLTTLFALMSRAVYVLLTLQGLPFVIHEFGLRNTFQKKE
ncbi:flippase-like domain-containing protein [Candidatus Woesebacteria bacterium]|nr:flippase-like domain-containing protein [Candidatus Woesebacteria bacterium]